MYVGLFVRAAVVFHVFMFSVGLLIVRLRFMTDIVLFIDCIDLFSCIAASLFNKLSYRYLLTYHPSLIHSRLKIFLFCKYFPSYPSF